MSSLVAVAGLEVPTRVLSNTQTPFSDLLIDAAGEKVAIVFRAPKTGTLDRAEFKLDAVTQAPVSGLRVSFQDVGAADGNPDGTQDQFRTVPQGSISAGAWVVPGLMTSDGTDGGTKRSVTKGDLIAFVVEFDSFAAGDSLEVRCMGQGANFNTTGQPYVSHFTAS